ncbi:hypothetical protein [Rhodococcoides fascians]|uniref:hypothetical protein n=1 Tax=Rhodococcoides fascians TaxID=1828 RepID=UPI001179A251
MRMRTLELPTVFRSMGTAEETATPFVIILDRFGPTETWDDEMANSLKSSTGAKGVVAFTEHEVELYNDVTDDDLARINALTSGDAASL